MGRISKIFKVLKAVLVKPSVLSKVLDDPDGWEAYVRSNYGFHNGLPSVDMLSLFKDCNTNVYPYSFLEGTSLVSDIALLNLFAARSKECEYLEIGSWRGESLANVARYAKDCTSISLSSKELRELGASEGFIKVHNFYGQHLKNVTHIGHNSQTFDFGSLNKRFDLIFVDGDHRYNGVRIDTQNVFNLLKDERSVIVWHDYGLGTERVRWSVLAGILDGCPKDKIGNLYHVENTMCAIYTRESLTGRRLEFPTYPNKSFSLSFTIEEVC